MATPQGIGFYNIKDGTVNYAKSEAQIQAYLNSSDMGINASRGQNYGWRIEPEWVKKIRAFRADDTKMSILIAKNGGQQPTEPQVLYAIYGEQLRKAAQTKQEESAPFEEEYLRQISSNPATPSSSKKPLLDR